jgi:hypothetical protein
LVYTKGNIPAEFSVSPYVNNATGTNTLMLGGTPLFTGASTSFVVQAAAGERMRVLADGNVPVIAGGAGSMTFSALLGALVAGLSAFAGVVLACKLLPKILEYVSFAIFGFYSWGMALLTFILFLAAV